MTHFHAITVKYLGATNHQGSRIKLTSSRFNVSKTIPYDYSLNNIEEMAVKYLQSKGFDVVGTATNLVITNTFDSIK